MSQTSIENLPPPPPCTFHCSEATSGTSAQPPVTNHIRLVDLHKRFASGIALDGLNMEGAVSRECVVVLGPSGTGKSVLLKHIVGLLRPDSGEVWFRDQRVDLLDERQLEPIRRRFGMLFQGEAAV